MNNAAMTLVLGMGVTQELDGVNWRDVQQLEGGVWFGGVEQVFQVSHEPGWEFTVKFRDEASAQNCAMQTMWSVSKEDPTKVYCTSAVQYETDQLRIILTTRAKPTSRILWRKWTIQVQEAAARTDLHQELVERGQALVNFTPESLRRTAREVLRKAPIQGND